jgi:CRP-like cAMP-binding protein
MFEKLKSRIEKDSPVDDSLIMTLIDNGQILNIRKGELLVTFGTLDDNVYFVANGGFLMSIITDEGIEKTTMFYLDDYSDLIICMDSYNLQIPTIYQVRAAEDSVVIKFSRKFIRKLLVDDAQFALYYIIELENMLANTSEICDARLSSSALNFLKLLYERYPLFFQHFSSQVIAEFMGITPVWLSNLKRKLFI